MCEYMSVSLFVECMYVCLSISLCVRVCLSLTYTTHTHTHTHTHTQHTHKQQARSAARATAVNRYRDRTLQKLTRLQREPEREVEEDELETLFQ